MIGQNKNKELLMQWRMNKSVPRFIIIEGDEGSGRLTLAKEIIKMIGATGIIQGNSIENVRETIQNAYTITESTCYIFRNVDDMSVPAKNSLLKVVEEPPNKAYFIMTLKSLDNMLDTIKSRGTLIRMQPYTLEQRRIACNDDLILRYTNNIGQAKSTDKTQINNAEQLAKDVLEALKNKSGTNLLKCTTRLKSKDTDEDKVDCELFMNVFMKNFTADLYLAGMSQYISNCKKELNRNSVNKKSSIECMLVNLLEVIKNAEVFS